VSRVIDTFTGLGFLFSEAGVARLLRAGVLPLLRWALHRPAVLTVFQNAEDRDRFVGAGLVPARRTRVIAGSGVDVARFAPGPPADGVPVALLAARLLWDKGVAEFVDAARRLRASGTEARYWVAGEADPGNPKSIALEQLKRWVEEGPVEFLGHRADMPELLRQVHVAVLPSYYHEGVPKFLLEAAAAGLPLVGSDIPGCRAVIEPEANGLLVPPRDPEALAAALGRLLRDSSLRRALGAAARATALERFDEQLIADQYEALYREAGVITTSRPAGAPEVTSRRTLGP
jgi:glycosyltransferase involved in cell wall biosynthesis